MNTLQKVTRKVQYMKHCRNLRKRLINKDFTLISQNCIGGVIYHMLGLQFMSPTINMFIEDYNFIKLVEDFSHYMSIEAKPLKDNYVDPINKNLVYPKIVIDDIEIACLHYKNCEEAIACWEKRKQRINYNNVYVIANSWNMHQNEELIERVLRTNYSTICFTYGKYESEKCIQLSDDCFTLDERGIVRPNITDYKPHSYERYFEDYIDVVGWLNE